MHNDNDNDRRERSIGRRKEDLGLQQKRSGKDRRVEQVTYGTGPALTEEEIIRANNTHACPRCGILHAGRECHTRHERHP